MKKISNVLVLTSLFIMTKCREPIDFVERGLPFTLVVSGEVINGWEVQQLTITAYQGLDEIVIRDAFVSINEYSREGELESTHEFEFIDLRDGIYVGVFEGKVGNGYELIINLSNRTYKSSVEKMLPVAQIDSITAKDFISDDEGIFAQIEVSASSNSDLDSDYYMWTFNETYEVNVPFPASYLWFNGPVFLNEPAGPCWISQKSSGLLISSTANASENRITKFPVRIISNIDPELRTKYSIEIIQRSLNEQAFNYYQAVQRITDRQGSLSDIQPGNIPGNILDQDGNFAIGYFTAVEEVSKRAFFSPFDFDLIANVPFNFGCEPAILNDSELFTFMNQGNNQDAYMIHQFFDSQGWYVVRKECADCSSYASTFKPSFWDE